MPDAAANDALGVLDRMTSILEAFDQDDTGSAHLGARAARRPSQVHGLPTGRDARAPAISRARREADPSGAAAVRARAARRAAAGAQGRRSAGHGRPSQQRRARTCTWPSATGARWCASPSCAAVRRHRRPSASADGSRSMPPRWERPCSRTQPRPTSTRSSRQDSRPGRPQTISDPVVLRRQLDDIRRGGLAVEAGEFTAGLSCAASAVFAPSGGLVGAISVSGCADGVDADRFAPAIRAAALALTRRLGQGEASGRTDARQRTSRSLRRSVIVATIMSPMSRRCESWSAGSSMSRSKMAANVCRLATWKHA